ncbi:hypothetical protein RFI_39950 [Reticulomyxa filosa]|uniref:Uncharacterized protein n=1 Tax=Reticulomyxa filosa TaxID=46433 RepID=X6LA14_RETFI|nr:hypothetical protein RFI_39950 [Reticulomyxa filosa]|eukprot:ETN97579.1 hypothetical protein RFI_39950 [Reticulomyxa filosa]
MTPEFDCLQNIAYVKFVTKQGTPLRATMWYQILKRKTENFTLTSVGCRPPNTNAKKSNKFLFKSMSASQPFSDDKETQVALLSHGKTEAIKNEKHNTKGVETDMETLITTEIHVDTNETNALIAHTDHEDELQKGKTKQEGTQGQDKGILISTTASPQHEANDEDLVTNSTVGANAMAKTRLLTIETESDVMPTMATMAIETKKRKRKKRKKQDKKKGGLPNADEAKKSITTKNADMSTTKKNKYWTQECDIHFFPYGLGLLLVHILSDCAGIVVGFLLYYAINRDASFTNCSFTTTASATHYHQFQEYYDHDTQFGFGIYCILLIVFSLANLCIFAYLLIFVFKHDHELSDNRLGFSNLHFRVLVIIGLLLLVGWVVISSLVINVLLDYVFNKSEIGCSQQFFYHRFSSKHFNVPGFGLGLLGIFALVRYSVWILWCCRACFWDCNCTECAYHYCCCFVRLYNKSNSGIVTYPHDHVQNEEQEHSIEAHKDY